jgi:hypothetical protein
MTKDDALDLALEALGLYQAAGFGNSTDFNKQHEAFYKAQTAIIAIKQARALDKKAENARELGLGYEPADGTQVSKVWWDGEKLMAKPIPFEDIYQSVDWKAEYLKSVGSGCITLDELREARAELDATNRQVEILSDALAESRREVVVLKAVHVPHKGLSEHISQATNGRVCIDPVTGDVGIGSPPAQPAPVQPVWIQPDHLQKAQKAPFLCRVEPHKRDDFVPLYTTPPEQPAVQEPVARVSLQWLAEMILSDCGHSSNYTPLLDRVKARIEQWERANSAPTPPAQPAVPDALNPKDENPAYAAGWNDCRAEMLKGMKP